MAKRKASAGKGAKKRRGAAGKAPAGKGAAAAKHAKRGAEAAEPEAAEAAAPVLRHRDYLFANLAAFVSGGCLMMVELVASRVLAPAFGNTVFLWTSVIGLILGALSVGYWLGGVLADRWPSLESLSWALSLAGLFVGAIPVLSGPVLDTLQTGYGPVAGPLLAATALFLVPGVIIGTITPMAVKLVALGGQQVGHAAGRVSALGALGSIAGTFSAGFLLIPIAGNRSILFGLALTLVVLSVIGFTLARRAAGALALFLLLPIGLCMATGEEAKSAEGVLYERQTFYHRVKVRDRPWGDRQVRVISLDTTPEGAMFVGSEGLPFAYTRYIALADLFVTEPPRAAFIGGGSYAMPKWFLDTHPRSEVDVYELDPAVVEVGERFFHTDEYDRLHHRVGDARRQLREADARYDLLFGDAYDGVHQVPAHLSTLEYYRLVRDRLTLGGIYMTNIIAALEGGKADFFYSTARTLGRVFPELYVFEVGSSRTEAQNLILVCPVMPRGHTAADIRRMGRGTRLQALTDTVVSPSRYEDEVAAAPLMTDDYAPVAVLVAGGDPE